MYNTPLCQLLNIKYPIIQAPIGNASGTLLASEVSNAGGLGMLSMTWRELSTITQLLNEMKQLTPNPFGVNFVLEWDPLEKLKLCLEHGVKIISLFWGDPQPYIELIHSYGALAMHTVGNSEEAKISVEKGVDVIVAQGYEAGGHVWGIEFSSVILPSIVKTVFPVPVIIAGGIADGKAMKAALHLGASGVWMGTRFLLSQESLAHSEYKALLVKAKESDTICTSLFNVGWANAPHRTLINTTITQWQEANCPNSGNRPKEGEVVGTRADGTFIEKYSFNSPQLGTIGDIEVMCLYAGQSVGQLDKILPVKEIISNLIQQLDD